MQFLDKIDDLYFLDGKLMSKNDIKEDVFSFSDEFLNLKHFMIFFKIKEECFEEKNEIEQKIKACLFKFVEVDVDIAEFQTRELVPFHIIQEYATIRNKHYSSTIKLIENKQGFDLFLQFYIKNKKCFSILPAMEREFNFGNISLTFAENFRLKSEHESFNVFNLRKELRHIIVPNSNEYVLFACDYKQFEFRTLLNLIDCDKSIFSDNLYENLGKQLGLESDVAKQSLIAWMYSDRRHETLDRMLDKGKILSKIDGSMFVFEGAPVYVGEHEANNKKLHTIVQTVSQFFYLRKLVEIIELLQNKKSVLAFPLHDSLVFFVHKSELWLCETISNKLESDVYKIKKYIGKNYKEIEEI